MPEQTMVNNPAKLKISFSEISKKLKVFRFPQFDIVVGIERGGIVPACLIAHQYDKDLYLLPVNYRDNDNNPKYDNPILVRELMPEIPTGKTILLVDDVSVSGKTMSFAKQILSENTIISFALKGKADLVLFSNINSCVQWPWNSQ